jgi:alpha-beta hydrolase superfamily lysophospholipase
VNTRSDRGVILLIHGLWFHSSVWTPWLEELDEAGYDAMVLSWRGEDRPSDTRPPVVEPDFAALLRTARRHAETFQPRPIVIGHGVGGVVAERLLDDGDAAAAISLAPVPGGYASVPVAAHLLSRRTRLALLSCTVAPSRRRILNSSGQSPTRAATPTRRTSMRGTSRRVSPGTYCSMQRGTASLKGAGGRTAAPCFWQLAGRMS